MRRGNLREGTARHASTTCAFRGIGALPVGKRCRRLAFILVAQRTVSDLHTDLEGRHAPSFQRAMRYSIYIHICHTHMHMIAHTFAYINTIFRASCARHSPYPVARGCRRCQTKLISCANSIVLARPVTRRQRLHELVLVFLQPKGDFHSI